MGTRGAWLLHRLAPPRVDPARTAGPAGVRVLAARRHTAHDERKFAIACKLSGNDAIVIIGRAAEPPVLLVEGDGARLFPAPEAGLPAADADPDRVRPERPDGRLVLRHLRRVRQRVGGLRPGVLHQDRHTARPAPRCCCCGT
ncbi:MAG: hypothetical protein M3Q39_04150 [Actinomycetota bacterium]|nr:hypothetical protein [Actinomycetota bacterium]